MTMASVTKLTWGSIVRNIKGHFNIQNDIEAEYWITQALKNEDFYNACVNQIGGLLSENKNENIVFEKIPSIAFGDTATTLTADQWLEDLKQYKKYTVDLYMHTNHLLSQLAIDASVACNSVECKRVIQRSNGNFIFASGKETQVYFYDVVDCVVREDKGDYIRYAAYLQNTDECIVVKARDKKEIR